MVWFLLAPVAVYGAKKLYDAIREPDPPSAPSSPPPIGVARAERTRVRRKAIADAFADHFDRVGKALAAIRLDCGLGPVNVNAKTPGVVEVDFQGYGRALAALNSARQCLDGESFDDGLRMLVRMSVPNPAEWQEKLLARANADYGDMAGITAAHTYDAQKDPFLGALRRLSL